MNTLSRYKSVVLKEEINCYNRKSDDIDKVSDKMMSLLHSLTVHYLPS